MKTTIEFDAAKRESLRKAYSEAVESGEKQFTWEGHELVTDYAKYLLQYLDSQGVLK